MLQLSCIVVVAGSGLSHPVDVVFIDRDRCGILIAIVGIRSHVVQFIFSIAIADMSGIAVDVVVS